MAQSHPNEGTWQRWPPRRGDTAAQAAPTRGHGGRSVRSIGTTSTKIIFAATLFFFTGGSQYHGASRKISAAQQANCLCKQVYIGGFLN